jgi:hypothetical protein
MNKSLAALMLVAMSALTLTGCFQAPQAQPETNPETNNVGIEDTTPPPADTLPTTESVDNTTVYNNTELGYAFPLPATWGKITFNQEGNNQILTSEDGKKTLKLYQLAPGEVNDGPVKLIITTEEGYKIYRDTYETEINILEGQGEDAGSQKALEEELKAIDATFYLINNIGKKIEEGGGGVAVNELVPGIAGKLDNFEKYSTPFTEDIIYGCNTKADDLNKKLKSGGVQELEIYKSAVRNIEIYKTTNPDKMTKAELEEIAASCSEGGSYEVLKATNDYIMWGFLACDLGPDADATECVKATDAIAAYFK